MLIVTIRTDKPEAEIGLYNDGKQMTYKVWQAHRQLAETIHKTILEACKSQDISLSDIGGIVCFRGPGSFTGLRIGLSVGNALSYSYQIPIVATQSDTWIEQGINRLNAGENDVVVQPEYDAPANTTKQKK